MTWWICSNCSKQYARPPSQQKSGSYCSRACYFEAVRPKDRLARAILDTVKRYEDEGWFTEWDPMQIT